MVSRTILLSASAFAWVMVAACGSSDDGPTGPANSGPGSPTATITAPNPASTFTVGQRISFAGSATDAEDGALSGTSLVWSSSMDGQIGSGTAFDYNGLTVGSHTITLKATDSDSKFGTETVSVTIEDVPDLPPVPPSTILIEDDIDDENGGVAAKAVTTLTYWNVTRNCVDLHGPGSTNPLPGNGLYLDMEGTYDELEPGVCSGAGRIESKETFNLQPGSYRFELVLAGNNQNFPTDTMTLTLGNVFSQTIILEESDPFSVYTYTFNVPAAASAKIAIDHEGADQQGILVDAIRLRTSN